MIVLDEQLLGSDLPARINRWYRVAEIPLLLRHLFATPPFQTRRSRLGKIARITQKQVQYYTAQSWAVQAIDWSQRRK